MWYVYVIEGRGGTWYTGITTDVDRRIRQHNGELAGGARFTKSRRPWQLVSSWLAGDHAEAARAEAKFKSLSKTQKRKELGPPVAT